MSGIAYAPATIANLGPGFDILGAAINGPGDIVKAEITKDSQGVSLREIVYNQDLPQNQRNLPLNMTNVVPAAANSLVKSYIEAFSIVTNFHINLVLYKNMKQGTGMGSSASSSVAAVVAVNEALHNEFGYSFERDSPAMLQAALVGEATATKNQFGHPDNALPALVGGFTFIHDPNFSSKPSKNGYIKFDTGNNLHFVVVSPHELQVSTGDARSALSQSGFNTVMLAKCSANLMNKFLNDWQNPNINDLEDNSYIDTLDDNTIRSITNNNEEKNHILSLYLAGGIKLLKGILTNNPEILGSGISSDHIVTSIRAKYIHGYEQVMQAALDAGAYGFSISGSGPAVFAVCKNENHGQEIGRTMREAFKRTGYDSTVFVSKINSTGAILLDNENDNKVWVKDGEIK